MIPSAAYFYSTTPTAVATGGVIPIGTGSTVMGTGITLSGGNTVTLASPGTYLVSYSWATDAQGGGEIVAASLKLNGTIVPGSQASETTYSSVGVTAQVTNTMIVTVPTAGSTLQLINSGAPSANTSTAGSLVADMNIVRIA
jgi:hypothetical protein